MGDAAGQPCGVCTIHADAAQYGAYEIARSSRWVVRHHPHPAPLAGWVFLCTVRHTQGPADLDDTEAAEFGPWLRRVSRAVRAVMRCDRVYAIAFGQGAPHMHVHLVPRHDTQPGTHAWAVADWYRAVESGARQAADPSTVQQAVQHLRAELAP